MRWIIGMGIIIVNVYCVLVFRLFLNFDCFDDIEWLVLRFAQNQTRQKLSQKNHEKIVSPSKKRA